MFGIDDKKVIRSVLFKSNDLELMFFSRIDAELSTAHETLRRERKMSTETIATLEKELLATRAEYGTSHGMSTEQYNKRSDTKCSSIPNVQYLRIRVL